MDEAILLPPFFKKPVYSWSMYKNTSYTLPTFGATNNLSKEARNRELFVAHIKQSK
jgi:hypothetical protein